MWIKSKRVGAPYIYYASRSFLETTNLAASLIIIVVCIIPLPFGTLGSGGGASAELSLPAGACVREPQEASQLSGGLREERLQKSPLSWVTRGVSWEYTNSQVTSAVY